MIGSGSRSLSKFLRVVMIEVGECWEAAESSSDVDPKECLAFGAETTLGREWWSEGSEEYLCT